MAGSRRAKEAEKRKTVTELAEETRPAGLGVDPEDFDDSDVTPYAVEGNDTSHYVNVSQEYRTYSGSGDADRPYPVLDENGGLLSTVSEADEKARKAAARKSEKSSDDNTPPSTNPGGNPPPPAPPAPPQA